MCVCVKCVLGLDNCSIQMMVSVGTEEQIEQYQPWSFHVDVLLQILLNYFVEEVSS